ncbi:MAG: hypothetical protein HYT80_03910 [Euryarchaeota archaeon]|nr:hypothetical protein [Euryarchaeota archaeon]
MAASTPQVGRPIAEEVPQNEPIAPAPASALAGRHRALNLALVVVAGILGVGTLLVPYGRAWLADMAAVWWTVFATATAMLVALTYSVVRLRRSLQPAAGPPLERPEPENIDFDAPWRQEDGV